MVFWGECENPQFFLALGACLISSSWHRNCNTYMGLCSSKATSPALLQQIGLLRTFLELCGYHPIATVLIFPPSVCPTSQRGLASIEQWFAWLSVYRSTLAYLGTHDLISGKSRYCHCCVGDHILRNTGMEEARFRVSVRQVKAANCTGYCSGSAFSFVNMKNSKLPTAMAIRTAGHTRGQNAPATWLFPQMSAEQALCSFSHILRLQFLWAAWILPLPRGTACSMVTDSK